jgi:GNAT superfamily N-acetyltransferase
VSGGYRPPELIGAGHDADSFECRSAEQTEWLRRQAGQSASSGTTRVLVVTTSDSPAVVAYYAWCMASIALDDAPPRARKGVGRYPQPVALLAPLAGDVRHEGRGIGAALSQDVVARTRALGDETGCRGLLVHADTAEARDFYLHLVPEFDTSPTDELHLLLLMKDIRGALK